MYTICESRMYTNSTIAPFCLVLVNSILYVLQINVSKMTRIRGMGGTFNISTVFANIGSACKRPLYPPGSYTYVTTLA